MLPWWLASSGAERRPLDGRWTMEVVTAAKLGEMRRAETSR